MKSNPFSRRSFLKSLTALAVTAFLPLGALATTVTEETVVKDIEPKPPGSICPVCASEDVEYLFSHIENDISCFECHNCQAQWQLKTEITVHNWAENNLLG